MTLWQLLNDLLFDYTLRTVALGAATLGIVSGGLGTFAVLRKQSLLGDALSHAALPGVVLAFMLTRSKEPIVLLLGATAVGVVATLFMMNIVRYTRIKEDGALAIVLSVFFGLGLMLLTFVQRQPDARQAGLNSFLFGQAATLVERDVITMAAVGGVGILVMILFWKEFKLLAFDDDFGATLGLPMGRIDVLLTSLLVVAIVIGLQAVGVVLMSAVIVAPAASARQWTDRLGLMVALAAFFGAIGGVGGAVISSTGSGLSTGPVVVLVLSIIVVISLTLAPNRGLLWAWVRRRHNRQRLRVDSVLEDMYSLARQHPDALHAHGVGVLQAMNLGRGGVRRTLRELRERGWAEEEAGDRWRLTQAGIDEVERRRLAEDTAVAGDAGEQAR